MAEIILVHGINNHLETADGIEATWIPALAGGVREAARGDLADRLTLPKGAPGRIECRAAYYGGIFRAPDTQGAGDDLRSLTPEQDVLVDELLVEWLERVAQCALADSADAVQASRTLAMIRDPAGAQVQGLGNLKRQAVKTLTRVSWFAKPGVFVAERTVRKVLRQVTRYLTDEDIRARARRTVLDLVDGETKIIIGHSLGSVVAYECAHRLDHPLPLLVTLGSPLGVRTIVTNRLKPPPSFPPMVENWLNLANREDFVAADPDLRPLFGQNIPAGSRLHCPRFQEPAPDPHRAETYLGRIAVGKAVAEVLDDET